MALTQRIVIPTGAGLSRVRDTGTVLDGCYKERTAFELSLRFLAGSRQRERPGSGS